MAGASSDISTELAAIFNENGVPQKFIEFLKTNNVKTVQKFASAAATEEKVETRVIKASGITDLTFGEEVAITASWNACRAQLHGSSSSSSTPAARPANKMPEGVEVMLRAKFRALHGFPLMGDWMVNEDTLTKIYVGLNAAEKSLHVPDIASMARRSDLNQKPNKGTLITESSVEHVEFSLDPCTSHPEFHLRMRAYLMSIVYLSVQNPEWFTFETALVTTDFLFEQINMRPDGKRPTLACVSACYLAMFGEYAKVLQNEGTSLDDWIKNKTNWQHLWKESVTSYESDRPKSDSGNYSVPNDLAAMVKSNSSLIRSMQGNFDRKLNSLARQQEGGKGDRKDGDKRRGFNRGRNGGKGQGKNKGGKNGKPAADRDDGKDRKVKADGAGAWRKRKAGRQ